MTAPLYYQYWGKASKEDNSYHLLPYHCLDVAAVADIWWQSSPNIRRCFTQATGLSDNQTRAWVLFFIALHDYGKFDLRFQRKSPNVWQVVNPELSRIDAKLKGLDIKQYYHGSAGLYWFYQDNIARFGLDDDDFCFEDNDDWLAWLSWLAPVTGHHGVVPNDDEKDSAEFNYATTVPKQLREQIQLARDQWLTCLADLFLSPAGLGLENSPPVFEQTKNTQSPATMLAGFCSVCDWLGSSDYFAYDAKLPEEGLDKWYQQRLKIAEQALNAAGVISDIKPYQNIDVLLKGNKPRQVQYLINELPQQQSLTLIEASTGSGKTEAALAYAWQLLALGLADSIVFALPTQATANAMLKRLETAAPLLFAKESNVVLAHGRAKYEQHFINLKQACSSRPAQGKEEAWVQCGLWLAQSKKRVFLGQIGVCTVDQVLVSVLPVKHKFVRGFGIGRSVLIIDEVHAYDSYMYGLLDAVLEQQRLVGGSAILLSATLPMYQKQQLAKAWDCELTTENKAYPLITSCYDKQIKPLDLSLLPEQRPQPIAVQLELIAIAHLLPDAGLLQRLLTAVDKGAQVCLVCNLVADAQAIYQAVLQQIKASKTLAEDQVFLFHSRFTFADRQDKEKAVLNLFGAEPEPKNARDKGHLLVATQVVEQSLDLDFDWLITQLCPVDLLFQRIGRLHRHQRNRPADYQQTCCTVLLPDNDDYELHELIYGNSRVLWRTQQLLQRANNTVTFPTAYREWIEPVYQLDAWQDEPEAVIKSFEKFDQDSYASHMTAMQLVRSSMKVLADDDSHVSALTRDGEMSLNLLPCYQNKQGDKCLLDGTHFQQLDESQRWEAINLNAIAVPASWGRHEQLGKVDQDGILWLPLEQIGINRFTATIGGYDFIYQSDTGLNRTQLTEEST